MSATNKPEGSIHPKTRTYSYDTLISQDRNGRRIVPTLEPPTLRYRHRALWLLAIYVPLLCVPWILTCLLAYKPAAHWSYNDQSGLSLNVLTIHRRLMNALAILTSVTSLVTVPTISALLAQAAVVYTQKRRRQQSVSVRQAFALADRGWSNLSILRESWPPWKTASRRQPDSDHVSSWSGGGSRFLWLAAGFLLVCGIQQPLREALVTNEQVLVMTWPENPAADMMPEYRSLGFDPEPDDLANVPEDLLVQDVASSLTALTRYDTPLNLWIDYSRPNAQLNKLSDLSPYERMYDRSLGPWVDNRIKYFVAAHPRNTTTGVLRNRVIRYNSTVMCSSSQQYPALCSGKRPFEAFFGREGDLQARICVSGERGVHPWTISRDLQTINETVVLHMDNVVNGTRVNLTQTCSVITDRGYFELGNYRNGYIHGPLLKKWVASDPFASKGEFNDYLSDLWRDNNTFSEYVTSIMGRLRRPSTEDKVSDIPQWAAAKTRGQDWPVPPGASDANITSSGPLMTAMLSMFGERSLFARANASLNDTASASKVLASICQEGHMPFSAYNDHARYKTACAGSDENPEKALLAVMSQFMFDFTTVTEDILNPIPAIRYISAAVYFATESSLLQTARKTTVHTARPIRSAPGQFILRPVVSLAAAIIVSILIFIQIVGLAFLAKYIYQVPTWTDTLDAITVARITASLEPHDVPRIDGMSARDVERLGRVDALIGVMQGSAAEEGEEGTTCHQADSDADVDACSSVEQRNTVQLGRGAQGAFHRGLVRFRVSPRMMLGNVELDCRCEGCRRRRDMRGGGAGEEAESAAAAAAAAEHV